MRKYLSHLAQNVERPGLNQRRKDCRAPCFLAKARMGLAMTNLRIDSSTPLRFARNDTLIYYWLLTIYYCVVEIPRLRSLLR